MVAAARLAEGPVFCLEQVGLVRDGRRVLQGIDLDIPGRGITAVVGPSGSGKSSLLRLLNRLEAPSQGVVRYRGEDVATLDPLAHRRRVGMVFQRPMPFAGSVRENLLVACPHADEAALSEALERAGLDARFLDRRADDLSGGECQRMCLARALAAQPEVLLLDEPTSALDEVARDRVERTGRHLADDGVPLVWVTHDPQQAERLADQIVRLAEGRILTPGPGARGSDDERSASREGRP
jgi:putative ABC transport system ATP-binding protein